MSSAKMGVVLPQSLGASLFPFASSVDTAACTSCRQTVAYDARYFCYFFKKRLHALSYLRPEE